ncbi:MAG: IS110 family transposase [bacterium]|nr:IS110 family transposase [bacterium]
MTNLTGRSQGAWAHLCGVAPIEASSDKVTRHRLNEAVTANANQALWRIALSRMSNDPRTRAYVERRTAEGKSNERSEFSRPWRRLSNSWRILRRGGERMTVAKRP